MEVANKKTLKEAETVLKQKLYAKYLQLTEQEIKTLIVEFKWLAALKNNIDSEIDRISQRLTNRVTELADRYEYPLPKIEQQVKELQSKVAHHLQKMGMIWN